MRRMILSHGHAVAGGTGTPHSSGAAIATPEEGSSEVAIPSHTVSQGGQGRRWKRLRRTGSESLDSTTTHGPNDSLLELYSSDLNNDVSKKRAFPMDVEGEASTEIVAGSTDRALGDP